MWTQIAWYNLLQYDLNVFGKEKEVAQLQQRS